MKTLPVMRSEGGARSGFSMIELIGMMAVVTILGLALMPAVIDGYDRVAREKESKALEAMAQGLRSHIARHQHIPDHTTISSNLASELGWEANQVLVNARRNDRVYLIDPSVTNVIPIPFNQTTTGVSTNAGTVLGALFVSSVGEPLPSGLVSGFASSHTNFVELWNLADGHVPTSWTWQGRGIDLRVERVGFGNLFSPLILNYDTYTVSSTNRGRYTINDSVLSILPSSPTFAASYLKGTRLGLHSHSGSTNTLQATQVIQHEQSFVYERDAWRGQLFLGRGMRVATGLDLQGAHDLFVAAPTNATALGTPAASPPVVVNAMSNYMAAFVAWKTAGYPAHSDATYQSLDAAKDALAQVTTDLLHRP